jgi:hypothetical protein
LVAVTSFEEVAAKVAVTLHVADHRLDGRSAPERSLMTVDSSLLAGDEDASGLGRAAAAIAFVDIDAFDLAPGQRLGFLVTLAS